MHIRMVETQEDARSSLVQGQAQNTSPRTGTKWILRKVRDAYRFVIKHSFPAQHSVILGGDSAALNTSDVILVWCCQPKKLPNL